MNFYVEQDESQAGNSPIALLPTPGLVAFVDLNPGQLTSVRGQFTIAGRTFAVCDTVFNEIVIVAGIGTIINRGTVSNDALPVTMAASPQQLLLQAGGTAYVFDLALNTLTAIPGATFDGPVSIVGICDDFFIVVIANSKEFYVSAPLDATDWVTNGNAIVSVFPDNIVGMLVDHREIWFWSDTQSVVYYDSGNIFPFDVVPGGFIEAGLAAKSTPAQLDNTVFWLGADARGKGKVWRGYGYTPQRVSNFAIEFAMQGYTRIDDAIAFSYQDQGHEFYVIYFPTPSVTWVYDTMTQMWHQRGYWLLSIGQFKAARYQNHTFNFGRHLVGDWQSGKIYEMHIPTQTGSKWTFADDDGNPIRRVRRAPHISKEQKRQYFSELQVFVETGLGAQGTGGSSLQFRPLAIDNFTRADENPLNPAAWTTTTGSVALQIVSDQCVVSAFGAGGDLYTGISFPDDQYAEVIYGMADPTFTDDIIVGVRASLTQGYIALIMSTEIILHGPSGSLGTFSGAINTGDLIRIYAIGTLLTVTLNGVTVITATDSALTGGQPVINITNNGDDISESYITYFEAGAVVAVNIPIPAIDPKMSLRWSDDNAHTWSNSYTRSCGKAGEYKKRVRWLRLGRARDRIFEISCSDAVGYRIVDAYLEMAPGTGT
jgi:hypothetical protein